MRVLLFPILFLIFAACSSSGTKQYLDLPGDLRVVPGTITCRDGSVGYAALVADNTPYGGKLKLLDGCKGEVDEDFSDGTKGTGKGILAGPIIGAFDLMVANGNLLVAAAIPDERRLVLIRLDTSFHRLGDDISVPLALVANTVNRVGEFFLVTGSDFVADRALLVSSSGEVFPLAWERRYDQVACDGERCIAYSSDDGAVYVGTLDRSGPVPIVSFTAEGVPDEAAALFPLSGVASLREERFVIWNEKEALVFNAASGETLARIPFPFEANLTAAAMVSYIASRAYESMSPEEAASYALIYVESADEDTFIVEEETPDSDGEQEPLPDGDMSPIAVVLAAEAPDADSDTDALDAQKAAAVWLSFDAGRTLAYDLVTGGWMYAPVGEGESTLPILKDAGVTIPEEGETTEANRPRITFIKAIRALPVSLSYEFTYEALFSSSLGDAGEWRPSDSLFVDRFAAFDRIITAEPSRYAVLLTEPPSGEKCLLPAGKAVSLEVRAVVDAHTLRVDAGTWGDEIVACYEGGISYGIYPKGGYLVRMTGPAGRVKEDIALELPAEEGPVTLRQVSYRDRYLELVIRRRTDEVVTSRGLSFAFTVAPSLSFFAPVTADLITRMEPTPNGHVLLFAPLRRTVYEYAPVFEKTVTTYR